MRCLHVLAGLVLLVVGCDSTATLVVDMRSDWGEAASVEVSLRTLDGEMVVAPERRSVDDGTALLDGLRVAELSELEQEDYTLTGRLFGADGVLLGERALQLGLRGDTVATLLVTRDCLNVHCGGGEQCQSGACVALECGPDRPDLCPEPECTVDTDCGSGLSACAVPRCADGVCLAGQDTSTCGAGEVCNPFDGCIPESCATPRSQVIANWDAVPRQTLEGPTSLGVMAFHEHGSRVVVSVEGVELARSEAPVINPRTGVPEHTVTLDPADFPDGPVILDALAESMCPGHDARSLSLPVFMNAGGSLENDARYVDCTAGSDSASGAEMDPFQSLDRALADLPDGGTVWLAAGTCYGWPSDDAARSRWTHIRPLPTLDRGAVEIRVREADTDASIRTRLHFIGVRMTAGVPEGFSRVFDPEEEGALWLDEVELAADRADNGAVLSGSDIYVTGGEVRDIARVTAPFLRGATVRGAGLTVGIGSDHVAIDLDVVGGGEGAVVGGFHPDGFVENLIVYGVRATGLGPQSWFGIQGRTQDVALVNTLIESEPPGRVGAAQLSGGWDHALFWHVTVVGTGTLVRGEVRRAAVENCLFARLGESDQPAGWRIRHNHFEAPSSTGDTPGQAFTLGEASFVDADADDYRLAPDSPAAETGMTLPDVPFDLDGRPYASGPRAAGALTVRE